MRRVKCVSSHTCPFYWWGWWLGFGGLMPGGVGLWCCCWPFVVVIWCVLTHRCAGGGHSLSLWSCRSCIHSLKYAKYSKKMEKKTYGSRHICVSSHWCVGCSGGCSSSWLSFQVRWVEEERMIEFGLKMFNKINKIMCCRSFNELRKKEKIFQLSYSCIDRINHIFSIHKFYFVFYYY